MVTTGKKVRRKRYFLFNSSQPELFGRMLIFTFLILILIASIFYFAANRELEKEWYKAHSTLKYVSEMFLPWLIMANVVGILIVALYSIFYTHRIAGASFRIKRDLEVIQKGDLTKKIKLRNRDQLQDVVESLNLVLEELKGKMEKISHWTAEMETSVEVIRHYTSEGEDKKQAKEEAVKLASTVRKIKEVLPILSS